MKIKYYISFLFLLTFIISNAQSNYYYYDNQKVFISIDREYISLNSKNNLNFLDNYSKDYISKTKFVENKGRSYAVPTDVNAQSKTNLKNYYSEIKVNSEIKNNILNYTNFVKKLNKNSNTIKASPCFKTISGKRLGLTNNFYVKIKSTSDVSTLYNYAKRNSLEVIGQDPYMPNWFILSSTKNNSKNVLEYANLFHESGLFVTAEPEFIYHDLLGTNDPHFSDQWGLKNTGQYGSSFTGIDINAEQAWNITKGNNVKVAIYDHGFEMDHPDLISNTFGNGFDATTGTSPSQVRGNHGTACAGIIGAAQNNNLGVSGVAPESDIVSISINLQFSDTPAQLASGFNWAWQNGVEVISNSWGGYSPSNIITDAIYNALNNGRNGLGTIIVFAAGNENNTNIRYPGSVIPEVLVVGAMSPCGERKNPSSCDGESSWGGCYGDRLDIVAPGVKIPTTDRQGSLGYTSNDYNSTFNGTSSACPYVAGVAALILSVNPNLTAQEVNTIIEEAAQKVGGYSYTNNANRQNGTWNEQMGYGLVDAYQAVLLAQSYNCSDNLSITDNVTSGQTDNQQAKFTIKAYNTISSSGNANYNAGSSVILKPGFHAISGSNFKAFIQGCSANRNRFAAKIREDQITETTTEYLEASNELTQNIEFGINIYPNPTSSNLNIESNTTIRSWALLNQLGQLLKVDNNSNTKKAVLRISDLETGVYLLRIQLASGNTITKRVMKN